MFVKCILYSYVLFYLTCHMVLPLPLPTAAIETLVHYEWQYV